MSKKLTKRKSGRKPSYAISKDDFSNAFIVKWKCGTLNPEHRLGFVEISFTPVKGK